MNNKGFTVVELIASFALVMVISVFLFEVLIDVKDIYVETTLKTSIQEKMGIISKNIKNVLPPVGSKVSGSGNSYSITNYKDGKETSGIILSYDANDANYVMVANQKFTLPSTVSIDINGSSMSNTCSGVNCYLKLYLVLVSDNLSTPYIYDVVYYYSTY